MIDQITIDARPGLTLDKTVFAAIAPEGEIRIDAREHDGHAWVAGRCRRGPAALGQPPDHLGPGRARYRASSRRRRRT